MAHARLRQGKEIKTRLHERFGETSIKRPVGNVVWIHAASNGESLSALPIIDYLQNLDNPPHIVMTTMTVTSANLIKKRVAPDNFTHQFIPYDHPSWVNKFQNHWQPHMAIWIESELWPNHLKALKNRNTPAILLNARLSNKSVRNWEKAKAFFTDMMSTFDTILAQTDRDADNLKSLGIDNVSVRGNLKDMAPALPYDPHAADDIRAVIESRQCLLFASTHAPEEQMAVDIHQSLKTDYPNLLTIIVPRHPKRGADIIDFINKDELVVAQRSLKMSPRIDTDIYVADTLGELGLFYHLCPISFIGNSINTKPGGGHNLMEPAWHHCAILSGDDLHNFSDQAREMPSENACIIVDDEASLLNACKDLLSNTEKQRSLSENAYNYVSQKHAKGMDKIIEAMKPTCEKAGIL